MSLYPVAGSTIDIGQVMDPSVDDLVAADFAGQSWLNIPWWESGSPFGDEAAEIATDYIDSGRTHKSKGTRNAGTMTCVFGIDDDSDGQATLYGAETTNDNFAFRITYPSGAVRYFLAQVMSAREDVSGPNNDLKLTAALGINSNVVRVAA